ncbi:MAG: hypothetical protein EHM70_07550 [Chloroflexota bacterium]|nr:MAG: hypothetical protein EHM70_07550 [Chloroflexota bacterium]
MKYYLTRHQKPVRANNLSSVLNYLHSHAQVSRLQIAGLTGLKKSTITPRKVAINLSEKQETP